MKQSPKRLPLIVDQLLQKLDVYGDDPVVFARDDIAPQAMTVMAGLIEQKLVSKCLACQVSCINCDRQANITRGGNTGNLLFALCKACGSSFSINEADAHEFRATWVSLSGWLSGIIGLLDEQEVISPNVCFIGNYQHGTVNYELHLMRGCSADDAKQNYQAIVQQKTNPVIILSLSNKPQACSLRDIKIVPLVECLVCEKGRYRICFPTWVFSGADPVKQRAGQARVANDPIHKQKEILHPFVRQNIMSKFLTLMHHEIAAAIIKDYQSQITYHDGHGNPKQLSAAMVRDVVKDVLIEKGLSERISGRKLKDE